MAAPCEGGAKHHGDPRPQSQRGTQALGEVQGDPHGGGRRPGREARLPPGRRPRVQEPVSGGHGDHGQSEQRLGLLDGGRAARPPREPAPKETKPTKVPRQRRPNNRTTESGESAPEIPDGTVGKHSNGKLACEVCGTEFDDEGSVTAHYVEAHAS